MAFIIIMTTIYILLYLWLIATIFAFNYTRMLRNGSHNLIVKINNYVANNEKRREDLLTKGKIKGLHRKLIFFLNDIMIDLGLKTQGIPLTEFLLFIFFMAIVISVLIGLLLFKNVFIGLIFTPFLIILFFCIIYTKTSNARYNRMIDILMTENLLSISIKPGIVRAVEMNMNSIPNSLKKQFSTFVNDVRVRNYEIEDALNMLCVDLGQVSVEFIQKVIIYEKHDQPGYENIFKEVIEINNIKMEDRGKLDRAFKDMQLEFSTSAAIIAAVTGGSIIIIPLLRNFYFRNIFGNILVILDIILIITVFLALTLIKSKEV